MSPDTSNNRLSRIADFLKSTGVREIIVKTMVTTLITGIITGIASITYGAVRLLVKCNSGLLTIMLIFLGLVLVSGSLFHIRFKKKEGEVPQFSERTRHFALAGLVAIPLLTLVGLVVWKQIDFRSPVRINILVADFEGPEQDYDVTGEVITQLRAWERKYANDLIITPLNETISEKAGGKAAASERGGCFKASIVLWGSYRVKETAAGHVYFEVLKGPNYLRTERERPIRNAEVREWKFRADLTSDLSYLTLLTIGLARYEAQEYRDAIDRFEDALRQPSVPKDRVSPAVLHFFKGLCYYETAQETSDPKRLRIAIQDYDETLKLSTTASDKEEKQLRLAAQFNRANARMLLGNYSAGQDARDIFRDAAKAYEDAANDYVDAGISEWAVKNNWGFALFELGRRLEGGEARDRLKAAVTEYNDAISICNRDRQEQDCALTYNNLGNTFYQLVNRVEELERDNYLEKAETAFRNALNNEYPTPPDVANNHANVLVLRGERTPGKEGEQFLRGAVKTYKNLVRVYQKGSQKYATAQYNLGYALLDLSERVGEEEAKAALREADIAFNVALDGSCREHEQLFPLCAMAERDLGITLHRRSKSAAGEDKTNYLKEALENLNRAAQFFSATDYPAENRKICDEQKAITTDLNSMQ